MVQGQALGRARTDCRVVAALVPRKEGICLRRGCSVTEDKQKGLGATGWLEMSVKGKERDERRCRSMDYFCYRSC